MRSRKAIYVIGLAVLTILFLHVFRSIYFPTYWIPTGGMEPTICGQTIDRTSRAITRSGVRIMINRLTYKFKDLVRGDIIVFRYPDKKETNPPMDFVKRLIGLPNDSVKIASGELLINGEKITEPYIMEPTSKDYEAVVSEGNVFVLGDNRNNNADSLLWGFLPIENIKGRVFFRYFPFSRFGFIERQPMTLANETDH